MINKIRSSGTELTGLPLPRLRQVCDEFEAVFLSHLLKTMRSSMAQGGVLGKSHQGEIMGSLVDEKIALEIAKKRGIGIGDLLFEKLRPTSHTSESEREHD